MLELLSGATPQPAGQREERRDDLYGLRGLTGSNCGSAAERLQHPVRVAAAHQPVRRRVVWHRREPPAPSGRPSAVHDIGGRVELASQRRRLRRAGISADRAITADGQVRRPRPTARARRHRATTRTSIAAEPQQHAGGDANSTANGNQSGRPGRPG